MNEVTIGIFKILSVFVISFVFALIIFPLWYYVMMKFRLGKNIRAQGAPVFQAMHQKKAGTLAMGGVIVWLVPIVIGLLFFFIGRENAFGQWINFVDRRETYLPLALLALAGVLGGIDDLFGIFKVGPFRGGMGIKEKIILYVAIALLVGWWFVTKLGIRFLTIPFWGRIYLGPIWYFLFLVFFILALSFSANETDGLDGLLGGVAMSTIFVLGIVSFINGNFNLAALSASVLGAILALLWFNIYPAKVFMGDTGSMAIGIFLAIVFLLEGIPLLALIMLPVFVVESGSVLLQVFSKKIRKKKLFLSTPIHHHFEAQGEHESSIVFRFWVVNVLGSILGLMIAILDKYL